MLQPRFDGPRQQVTTFMNDLDAKLEVFGEEICTLRTRYECRSLSDTEDSQVLKQCLKEAQKHLYFLRARVLMAEKTSMAVEASLTLGRDKNSEAESNCSVVCVTLPVSTVFQATLAILTVEMWKVGAATDVPD
eukprot:g8955.t1